MGETQEGSAWFWKTFGGAVIGMTTLLLGIILNHFASLHSHIQMELSLLKEKVTTLEVGLKDRATFSEMNALRFENTTKEQWKRITDLHERVVKLEVKK